MLTKWQAEGWNNIRLTPVGDINICISHAVTFKNTDINIVSLASAREAGVFKHVMIRPLLMSPSCLNMKSTMLCHFYVINWPVGLPLEMPQLLWCNIPPAVKRLRVYAWRDLRPFLSLPRRAFAVVGDISARDEWYYFDGASNCRPRDIGGSSFATYRTQRYY